MEKSDSLRDTLSPFKKSAQWIRMSMTIVDISVSHRTYPHGFRWGNTRYARFLILGRWRWSKTNRMWWEVLSGYASWYSKAVRLGLYHEMGACMKSIDCMYGVLCNKIEMIKVLQLFITISLMAHFEQDEHEANWLTPHHIFAEQRAIRAKRIQEITSREKIEQAIKENYQLLDEMEPWQYLGAFPFWHIPYNILK